MQKDLSNQRFHYSPSVFTPKETRWNKEEEADQRRVLFDTWLNPNFPVLRVPDVAYELVEYHYPKSMWEKIREHLSERF